MAERGTLPETWDFLARRWASILSHACWISGVVYMITATAEEQPTSLCPDTNQTVTQPESLSWIISILVVSLVLYTTASFPDFGKKSSRALRQLMKVNADIASHHINLLWILVLLSTLQTTLVNVTSVGLCETLPLRLLSLGVLCSLGESTFVTCASDVWAAAD